MEVQFLNAIGLKCPEPILRIAVQASISGPGNILEVLADCPTFERDVREWCERVGKTILSVENKEGYQKIILIQL